MSLHIYWGSGSPYAWRALLTAEVKGLEYESHLIEFSKKEHKSPEYLKMNPRGKVPVLLDGDVTVYESLAIMTYLDAKHPEPALFGTTPKERAAIMQAVCEFTGYVEPAGMKIARGIMGKKATPEELLEQAAPLHEELKRLDAQLAEGPYMFGLAITAADIVAFPHLQLLLRIGGREEVQELGLKFTRDTWPHKALNKWLERIESLPFYDKTYPPHWKS